MPVGGREAKRSSGRVTSPGLRNRSLAEFSISYTASRPAAWVPAGPLGGGFLHQSPQMRPAVAAGVCS